MVDGLSVNDEIIIYCAAGYGEEICLKFISLGYRIVGFCDNAKKNKGTLLLGLPVYDYKECRMRYPKAVYIVANSCYATALEIGMELEEDGYIKNVSYYLSIELDLRGVLPDDEVSGIQFLLNNRTLVLFGNQFLCSLFEEWAYKLIDNMDLYICQTEDEITYYKKACPDAIWIPLERETPFGDLNRKKWLAQLQEYNIHSFSRFFLQHMVYCEGVLSCDGNIEKGFAKENEFRIQKVVFLKTSSFSGSFLMDSILDSHPNILYLEYHVGSDIWHIIKYLRKISKKDLAEEITAWMKGYLVSDETKEEDASERIEKYRQILNRYLQTENTYSERDLFMIIYLTYYELLHGTVPRGELIIYMDIHSGMRMRNSMFIWFEKMGFEIILLELIRDPLKRLGSAIKYTLGIRQGIIGSNTILNLLYMLAIEAVDDVESQYPIIRIRFEDLKKYPKQILGKLCGMIGIPWSDSLLRTTFGGQESVYVSNGDQVTGFDLKPVYYSYDEYFDAFDKFRLDLIFREKNRAYGYLFVDRDKYPVELESLGKLFAFPFLFEKFIDFKGEADRKQFRRKMELLCTQLLFLEDEKEKYAGHFQFGDYLKVERRRIME
ncbi:MAG TPA: hypothetical protein DDY31_00230 [Lachnospiraceae bacterium]|nr:hypothetical protein [Lachnospiraceae bacterium]